MVRETLAGMDDEGGAWSREELVPRVGRWTLVTWKNGEEEVLEGLCATCLCSNT